jgi:hypothetical protein
MRGGSEDVRVALPNRECTPRLDGRRCSPSLEGSNSSVLKLRNVIVRRRIVQEQKVTGGTLNIAYRRVLDGARKSEDRGVGA